MIYFTFVHESGLMFKIWIWLSLSTFISILNPPVSRVRMLYSNCMVHLILNGGSSAVYLYLSNK